jgi:formylglycine-generating enzyme required for sulfatase activity
MAHIGRGGKATTMARAHATTAFAPLLLTLVSCQSELPPYGEALFHVDINAAVPALGDTLRVDVYRLGPDGSQTWSEHRELTLDAPELWPATFSIFTPAPRTEVIVRLRFFAQKRVRDYRGERFFDWPSTEGNPLDYIAETPAVPNETPRLTRAGVDETPITEPEPLVAIDRLVQLTLVEGEVRDYAVTLSGECFGTMANMTTLETCVDTERVREAAKGAALGKGSVMSQQGSWPSSQHNTQPCPASWRDTEDTVCVPGGAFIVGEQALASETIVTPVGRYQPEFGPERVAVVDTMLVDRREMTVGQFRALRAKGLRVKDYGPLLNEGPLDFRDGNQSPVCTYTQLPGSRENYPLNCIQYRMARETCEFAGGQLLSDVQWEYLASNAFTGKKTRYPWGNQPADCQGVIVERNVSTANNFGARCNSFGVGLLPTDAEKRVDVNALGIVDLIGNLAEFTRDGAANYRSRCWLSSALPSVGCNAGATLGYWPRGDSWESVAAQPAARHFALRLDATQGARGVHGVRCVYPAPESR